MERRSLLFVISQWRKRSAKLKCERTHAGQFKDWQISVFAG